MHKEVIAFILEVKRKYPNHFMNTKVLDCGSLDINGNNRKFFESCDYTGIDIVRGKNVDVVTRVHEFLPDSKYIYDVVISTEMLEHDRYYKESVQTMFRLLKSGGLLLITAASTGRKEHGTKNSLPADSPLTNYYYQNITVGMLTQCLSFSDFVGYTEIHQNKRIGDIYFVGVKK